MYLYYIIICVGVLPAGAVSHVAPVKPPAPEPSPSLTATVPVPVALHWVHLDSAGPRPHRMDWRKHPPVASEVALVLTLLVATPHVRRPMPMPMPMPRFAGVSSPSLTPAPPPIILYYAILHDTIFSTFCYANPWSGLINPPQAGH